MLRRVERYDIPAFAELNRQHFATESAMLLADPDGFRRVLERAFRWDTRVLLGLLRLVGRPIGDFYALEADGKLAGLTFSFYEGPSAHLANVVVDTPFRGRGFAKRMIAQAEADARRRRCRHMVLEVLEENGPAIALYRALGYLELRRSGWYFRDIGPDRSPLPAAVDGGSVRRLRRGDGVRLAAIAGARMSERDRAIRPVRAGAFRVPHTLTQVLGGETEGFVLDEGAGPVGFVRASTARAMGSGHLTALLTGPGVGEPAALALLDRALAWFRGRSARRIICEAPEDDPVLLARLAARGFHRGIGSFVLTKPLDG